ncbi:hypothetical protein CDD81_3172 [Ophiocordyceps australis]|uniref:ML-like domain-containing protein n=1 Tax=Ophiocordyceps australis TaxID=1399860 RepID=A0A2C5XVJ6_9HYPO|nr:hypothetical protein CDD81_3172 [Ophiocordyceps australis]
MLALPVSAADILKTDGFNDCGSDSSIKVDKVDIIYDKDHKTVDFDVAGSSTKEQNVTAELKVTAYGTVVYTNSFNPCDQGNFVERLCPVPKGDFAAKGSRGIPSQFADMVPAIAFQVPDIAAQATLELKSLDNNAKVACIQSQVSNGKTANVPVVGYVVASFVGVAVIGAGISSAATAFSGGASGAAGSPSPSPSETCTWIQAVAMTGMSTVNYPLVCRKFFANVGFAVGIISWEDLQRFIDNVRAKTGGDLTEDSVEYLHNATLVFPDNSTTNSHQGTLRLKRGLDAFASLVARQATTDKSDPTSVTFQHAVKGIQAYAEQLAVPKSNVFMTALLVVAIAIAAIVVGILLVKVVLEFWALFGSFPKSLAGFRKHYWGSIARTITSLILVLYGIWVLYCIYQFTHGDSWAAKTLAGVTLAIFTAVLGFFTYKIWSIARRLKHDAGDASGLYYDKDTWVKYSLFYEAYKKDYWWLFIPAIVYMFAKGCALALGDGHGMIQSIAQLAIETIMLVLLLWSRPYERKSGNVINIVIAVVRVLSIVCVLVFVEEFGIKQTTQTVAGVVLIVIQSALTGILAILIIWNAVNACCKVNPHRQRRKELEKDKRESDLLTPLDARNSLLRSHSRTGALTPAFSVTSDYKEKSVRRANSPERYFPEYLDMGRQSPPSGGQVYLSQSPPMSSEATHRLVDSAAPIAGGGMYEPNIPNAGYNYGRPAGQGFGVGNGPGRGHRRTNNLL